MKKAVMCFIFMMLAVQVVSSTITNINVKSIPGHEIQMTIIDSSSTVLERFSGVTDEYGDVFFEYNSAKPTFDIILCLREDEETIFGPKKFIENYLAGENLYLEFAPSWFKLIETPELVVNETNLTELLNETVDILLEENISEEKSSVLSGYFISGTEGILKYKYYIFGVVFFLFLVFFIFKTKKYIKVEKQPREIKVKKMSDLRREKEEDVQRSKDLEEAERRLREAQEEVNSIKNKDKINEIKKRIVEEQQELIRLRKGEN
ncbi:MAG: hypothetical protein ABH804_01485 [archaeon]